MDMLTVRLPPGEGMRGRLLLCVWMSSGGLPACLSVSSSVRYASPNPNPLRCPVVGRVHGTNSQCQ